MIGSREAGARGWGNDVKLLLLDTCGQDGSVALAETGLADPVLEIITLPGRTASERLIGEMRGMMRLRGWAPRDLAAVGVVSGPGSFTGVRVGMAAAKGVCEGAGVPLVSVSRLEVLANKGKGSHGTTHALLDAGRGEFFYGRYESGEPGLEALLSRAAVLETARGGRVVVCEESVYSALTELHPVMTSKLDAADALALVVARVEREEFSDVASSDANYLRRTEIEMLAKLAQRAAEQ